MTSLYPTEYLRRCLRCGRRSTVGARRSLLLQACVECGIPFLADAPAASERAICEECGQGRLPSELPDRHVAEATESELVLALERSWSFVGAASLSTYLDRLAAQIHARMDTGLDASGVALFEESRFWTLALPSGRVLMSLGAVAGLEDEAELAFVLAHELAHASSIDASARLVRLGLRLVAQERREDLGLSWSDAAHDVIRVGYGRARERDADRRAFRTVVAMGYDPSSIFAYLRRMGELVEQGDVRVAELGLAHPLSSERARWLEAERFSAPTRRAGLRVNREVFRRVAGHDTLGTRLAPVDGIAPLHRGDADDSAAERRHRGVWIVVSLALLAAVLAVVASYLT